MKFIEKYFLERQKMLSTWKKSMLIFQCGSFYEIYGLVDYPNDPIWDYQRIMPNCTEPWVKGTYKKENDVLCCGWPVSKFFNFLHLFVPEGWKIDVWNEIGEQKIKGKKVKIHGFFKSFSPGTYVPIENDQVLTNNCSCIWIEKSHDYVKNIPYINVGMSTTNTISGKSYLYEYKFTSSDIYSSAAYEELDRFNSIHNPKEIWLIHNLDNERIEDIKNYANLHCNRINIYSMLEEHDHSTIIKNSEQQKFQIEILSEHFKPNDPEVWFHSYGFYEKFYAVSSFCVLLKFMILHNPQLVEKLISPEIQTLNDKLILRTHSLKQLNIIDTHVNNGQYSSINKLINKCKTSMGKREFKNLLVSPRNNIEYLNREYNIIDHILNNYNEKIQTVRSNLKKVFDIERLYRKIILNKTDPTDISYLYTSLLVINELNDMVLSDSTFEQYIVSKNKSIPTKELTYLIKLLKTTFKIDVCKRTIKIKEESLYNRNVYEEVDYEEDKWNQINNNLKEYKNNIELVIGKEGSIHLHKTDKSGVFLRTTASRAKKFMDNVVKGDWENEKLCDIKTPSCGESKKKFVSHELTQLYNGYTQTSENFIETIECKFKQFIKRLKSYSNEFYSIIKFVTDIDIVFNKAYISHKYKYTKPKIRDNDSAFFQAENLRHPLIEHIQTNELYVPNDVSLGKKDLGILLYGTNGCGKSSIIRAIGDAIIMAQIGMYVAATDFVFKPYHSLFTRILGNDNLFKGLSTFATEMSELQSIIEFSDKDSLILGDELCSGTEIPSAISIFTGGLLLLNKKKCSHIFATHFHELENIPQIKKLKNLTFKHMSVIYDNEKQMLIYERKLEDGRGRANYGLEVCKQYNFPTEFFEIAYKVRGKFVKKTKGDRKASKYSSKKLKGKCEWCDNDGVEIHHLEPQEKADLQGYINNLHHKNHTANLANICKKCHLEFTKNKTIHKRVKTTQGFQLIEQ